MKRVLYVVGALFWAFLVFVVTFRFTFPSDAIRERIRYEVPNLLGEEYSADIGQVAPWWVGLSVDDLKLYKTADAPPPEEEEEDPDAEGGEPAADGPTTELVAMLKNFSLRVSPWSLVRRAPYLSGSIGLTEGRLDFSIGTGLDKRGEITVADLSIQGTELPMADLMAMAGAGGEGQLGIEVDLHAGESGTPRDADGRAVVHGAGLVLSDLEFPGIGPLGMDLPISDLNFAVDFVSGKGTISEGKINSEMATVTITGEVTLREPVERSTFDATISLSNLSAELTSFEGLMASAKQSDGTYQFTCRGVVGRIQSASCSMKGERRAARSSPVARPPRDGSTSSVTDEEREKHREEIRERLRQRREEREAGRAAGGVAAPSEAELPPEEEEEGEELPPEDELPEGEEPGSLGEEEPLE